MDTILFTRLEQYISTNLRGDLSNVSRVVVLIMQFVEKTGGTYKLTGPEKKQLCLTYLQQLVSDLSEDILKYISDFIDAIVLASQGGIDINKPPIPSTKPFIQTPLSDPPMTKKKLFGKAKSCLDSSSVYEQ